MIKQLFINSCVLITAISLFYHFIKNKEIVGEVPLVLKLLLGICGGLLGILLMMFSVKISPKIITDFRIAPILLCSIYGGFTSSITASIIIAAYRIIYFGVSKASVIAVIVILITGIGFDFINGMELSRKRKWVYCITYFLIINTVPIIILIKDPRFFIKVFVLYYVSNILVYYFIYGYTEYLSKSLNIYKKYKNEATLDYLTGLFNVRQFNIEFNKAAQKATRYNEALSLLFLDIDYYKKVNDNYGHAAGDIVLKEIASILKKVCREYDVISRSGGEEFTVLLLNCDIRNALEVAGRIRKNISNHKFYISDKVSIKITISIGISTYPNLTTDIDNLLENADEALYEAKRGGRDKVVVYSKKENSN